MYSTPRWTDLNSSPDLKLNCESLDRHIRYQCSRRHLGLGSKRWMGMNSVDHSFIPHFPAEATNCAFVEMKKIKRAYSETWRLTNSQIRNSQTQNFFRRPIFGAMQLFSMDLSFVIYHLLSSFLLCEALDLENWNISIGVFTIHFHFIFIIPPKKKIASKREQRSSNCTGHWALVYRKYSKLQHGATKYGNCGGNRGLALLVVDVKPRCLNTSSPRYRQTLNVFKCLAWMRTLIN